MPMVVTALATSAVAGSVAIGAGTLNPRKVLAALVLVAVSWALMIVLWTRTYAGVQPRYFLPLVMVFVGIMLLPRRRGRRHLVSPAQAELLFAALAVAKSPTLLAANPLALRA